MSQQWKLVPVDITPEKTPEMFNAALKWGTKKSEWQELLAAVPQPPALGGELEVLTLKSGWLYHADGKVALNDEHAGYVRADHVARLQAEVSQLRQHKNDFMEAAEETRKALQAEFDELTERWAKLQTDEDGKFQRVCAERDKALTRNAELEGLLRDAIGEIEYYRGDKHACKGLDIEVARAALNKTEGQLSAVSAPHCEECGHPDCNSRCTKDNDAEHFQ